jgi:hypothetical protein
MNHILEYYNWTSTATVPSAKVSLEPAELADDEQLGDVTYSYKSKDKTWYGIHKILLSYEGKTGYVKAKFDTGARTSSLDIAAARKLGVPEHIIEATKELEKVKIEKTISKEEQDAMKANLSNEYRDKYPGVSKVEFIKSASGFSVRLYIRMTLNYDGRIIHTDVNLKDRTGMKAEMLVGLSNML